MNIFYKIFFGLILLVFFATPAFSYAASIYFVPSSGSYTVGEQFSINIFVSSDAQEMNAAKATIKSLNNNLQIVSVSQAGSIIDFWAQKPQLNGNNSAYFEGVMLGSGYSGSAGKLVTLVVRARAVGSTALVVSSGSVLANDGLGTKLSTNLGKANFSVSAKKTESTLVSKSIPDRFVFTKDLQQRDKGEEVKSLQICLKDLGFYTEDITGYFGTKTKQSVMDFQEHYQEDILTPWGFEQGTGLVQKTTREKLNAVCFKETLIGEIKQPKEEKTIPNEVVTKEKTSFYTNVWFWVGTTAFLLIVVILLLLIIISLLLRRTSELRQRQEKLTLRREKSILRRTHKRLLTTKTKIEKELQETENKLEKFSKE